MTRHPRFPHAALAAFALLAAGCGREAKEEVQAGPPPDPVASRLQDKAYVQALETQRGDFSKAMKQLASAREAFDAAKASGESAERLAQLSNEVASAEARVLENRRKSADIVRRRIMQGLAEKKAQEEQLKGHQNKETTK